MRNNQPPLAHPNYRADIDGLRAIAVLAVVFFHAFPNWIKGGFIGVDIFFVISGFLISTIIFSSLERNSFSFVEFYSRRIRRIYPALLLVLIACFAFGWFVLLADEYKQLGKHMAGGAAFVANYVLWNESGYFDNIAETKPLLHLWSLGIEEQFYIVWPILLWLAWKNNFNRLTILFTITAISFYLNINIRHTDATAMFYSPQTRFWELLIGSVLAYFTLHKWHSFSQVKNFIDVLLGRIIYENAPESNGKTLRNSQSILGALFITVGFLIVTKERAFPGWWAILPTIGAALIISGGSQAWINRTILSNRILVWFGLISFPLYLWHWPLLSFARIIEAETPSKTIRILAILLAVFLAWLTYQFIEKPLRFGKYGRLKTILLFLLMIVVGLIGYDCFSQDGLKFRPVAKNLAQKSLDLNPYKIAACYDEKYSKLKWPYYTDGFCNQSNDNKKIDYVLWGDSHAEHLLPGLKKIDTSSNYMLVGRSSCPPIIEVKLWRGRYFDSSCKMVNVKSLEYITKISDAPVVILSSLGSFYFERQGFAAEHKEFNFNEEYEYASKNQLPNRKEIFESGLQGSVNAILAAGKKVVLVKDVPEFPVPPKSCLDRPFKINKKNCDSSLAAYEARTKGYDKILSKIKESSSNVYIFDAAALFCDDKLCKSSDEQHIYFRDGHHLTTAGSDKVAKALMAFLNKIKN